MSALFPRQCRRVHCPQDDALIRLRYVVAHGPKAIRAHPAPGNYASRAVPTNSSKRSMTFMVATNSQNPADAASASGIEVISWLISDKYACTFASSIIHAKAFAAIEGPVDEPRMNDGTRGNDRCGLGGNPNISAHLGRAQQVRRHPGRRSLRARLPSHQAARSRPKRAHRGPRLPGALMQPRGCQTGRSASSRRADLPRPLGPGAAGRKLPSHALCRSPSFSSRRPSRGDIAFG